MQGFVVDRTGEGLVQTSKETFQKFEFREITLAKVRRRHKLYLGPDNAKQRLLEFQKETNKGFMNTLCQGFVW